jgi:hypothetical protein
MTYESTCIPQYLWGIARRGKVTKVSMALTNEQRISNQHPDVTDDLCFNVGKHIEFNNVCRAKPTEESLDVLNEAKKSISVDAT